MGENWRQAAIKADRRKGNLLKLTRSLLQTINHSIPAPVFSSERKNSYLNYGRAALLLALLSSCLIHVLLALAINFSGKVKGSMSTSPAGASRIELPVTLSIHLRHPERFESATIRKIQNTSSSKPSGNRQSRPKDPNGATEWTDILPIAEEHFYTTSELTAPPEVLTEPELDPNKLFPLGLPGKIVLKLWINHLGEVIQVTAEAEGQETIPLNDLLDAFKELTFKPGEIGGVKVNTVMKIEVFME